MEEAKAAQPSSSQADGDVENNQVKGDRATETIALTLVSEVTSDATEEEAPAETATKGVSGVNIKFVVVFNKQKLEISWNNGDTIASLKTHLQTITGVPPALQKLMFKGLAKDDKTLAEAGVTNGAKMMLVGSKLTDVIQANTLQPKTSTSSSTGAAKPKREPLSKQKPHAKIVDEGIPEDAMPAYKNGHEPLPEIPLFGMLNKYGHKVRLTFKLESDQVWIGTKERTEKVSMNSIKQVVSEPIAGHEEYHMLAVQRGPTEQSRNTVLDQCSLIYRKERVEYLNLGKDILDLLGTGAVRESDKKHDFGSVAAILTGPVQ